MTITAAQQTTALSRFNEWLFRPVDSSSLAVFRIGFGMILLFDMLRYLLVLCLSCNYIEPQLLFKYYGFEWVQRPPGEIIHWHFAAMALLATGIMLGYFYRLCTILFTLGFSYIFLLDQALYLNHFYMVLLFCTLMCFIPAHHQWSVDAYKNPAIKSDTIPYWCLFILASQLEIILLYAGLVKINPDWLNLEPLRMWLSWRADFPVLGTTLFAYDWSIAIASYGVIALHLIGAPLLLVRKTRLYVLGVYASFHTLNHFVFNIGIFPWMTLFASLLFFDPNWPKQFSNWLQTKHDFFSQHLTNHPLQHVNTTKLATSKHRVSIYFFILIWIGIQIIIPLRHWVYPGNVAWNEQGHRFSWRMKLRSKQGNTRFFVQSGSLVWHVKPADYLSDRQVRKMSCLPDLILQFSHFIAEEWRQKGYNKVQVYADAMCSLNGRPRARLIDRQVDLAATQRHLGHNPWILPLQKPLTQTFW